jgi:uncharacterized C2H2 Zn-finger protein
MTGHDYSYGYSIDMLGNIKQLADCDDVQEALAKRFREMMGTSSMESTVDAMETGVRIGDTVRERVLRPRDIVRQEIQTAVRPHGSVPEDGPSLVDEDGRAIDASQQAAHRSRRRRITSIHACGHCGMVFKRSKDLERHVRTHGSPHGYPGRCPNERSLATGLSQEYVKLATSDNCAYRTEPAIEVSASGVETQSSEASTPDTWEHVNAPAEPVVPPSDVETQSSQDSSSDTWELVSSPAGQSSPIDSERSLSPQPGPSSQGGF